MKTTQLQSFPPLYDTGHIFVEILLFLWVMWDGGKKSGMMTRSLTDEFLSLIATQESWMFSAGPREPGLISIPLTPSLLIRVTGHIFNTSLHSKTSLLSCYDVHYNLKWLSDHKKASWQTNRMRMTCGWCYCNLLIAKRGKVGRVWPGARQPTLHISGVLSSGQSDARRASSMTNKQATSFNGAFDIL